MPARRRTAALGAALATLLLGAGCGGSEPEPLQAREPDTPADLCATIPEDLTSGLVANGSTDTTANPTAACSLRSPVGAEPEVRAIVTWVQVNDEDSADEVLDSQCRSMDPAVFTTVEGFSAQGAERACAATGTADGAGSTTMAALADREVVTVRLTEAPAGKPPVQQRAQQILEGVLASLSG